MQLSKCNSPFRFRNSILVCLAIGLTCGCSSENTERQNALDGLLLKDIYSAYARFTGVNGHSPASAAVLLASELKDSPESRAALEDGSMVMIWAVNLDISFADPNLVLGYRKDVPTSGGPVCFVDGRVIEHSSTEFAALTHAKATPVQVDGPQAHNTEPVIVDGKPIHMLHTTGGPVANEISEWQPGDAAPESEAGKVQLDHRKYTRALIDGDIDTLLDFTHPKVIELIGGEGPTKLEFLGEVQKLRSRKVTFTALKFPEAPTFLNSDQHQFVIVPYALEMTFLDKHISSSAYRIGIRADDSAPWKYIHGEAINQDGQLQEMFPDFPENVSFPEVGAKDAINRAESP